MTTTAKQTYIDILLKEQDKLQKRHPGSTPGKIKGTLTNLTLKSGKEYKEINGQGYFGKNEGIYLVKNYPFIKKYPTKTSSVFSVQTITFHTPTSREGLPEKVILGASVQYINIEEIASLEIIETGVWSVLKKKK